MLGKIRKTITLFTALAVLSVYSMVAFAASPDEMGEITVNGSSNSQWSKCSF